MAVSLLGRQRHNRLLEIGYGSGVFLPELERHCDELHGVDPHPMAGQVREGLARQGIRAELATAPAEELPYPDAFFSCAVAISALECVPGIEAACREIRRVLVPKGVLVVVTPGATPLWDLALRLTTGENASLYAGRRERLQSVLHEHFRVTEQVRVPPFGGRFLRLYTGMRLQAD
jgi:SAM-dependent methyltransferase